MWRSTTGGTMLRKCTFREKQGFVLEGEKCRLLFCRKKRVLWTSNWHILVKNCQILPCNQLHSLCLWLKALLWRKNNLVWAEIKSSNFEFQTLKGHSFLIFSNIDAILVSIWRGKIGQYDFMTNSISKIPQHCTFCDGTPQLKTTSKAKKKKISRGSPNGLEKKRVGR